MDPSPELSSAAQKDNSDITPSAPTPLRPASTNESDHGDMQQQQLPNHDSAQNAAEPNVDVGQNATAQPATTQPAEQPDSGISSVAQFIPSDANVNHSTPNPAQPLATDAHDPDVDATMTDGAGDAPSKVEDVMAPAEQVSAPAAELLAASDGDKVANAASDADQPLKEDQLLPKEESSRIVEPKLEVPDSQAVVTSTEVASDTAIEPKPQTSDVDQVMSDVSASGIIRQREDDATSDEPSAKRARTEDQPATEVPEFKRPDLPDAQASTAAAPSAPAAPVSAPAPATAPAVNGTQSSLPPRKTYSTASMGAAQKKSLEEKIKNTKKIKAALNFLKPVDHVALGLPHYPEVIKNPMDLGTMEHKLKTDQYSSHEDFVNDFDLMVNNCFTFNGINHVVSISAQNLRAYFIKQMDSVPSPDAALASHKAAKKSSPVPKPPAVPLPRRESRASVVGNGGGARSPTAVETFALTPSGTPQIRRDSTAGRPKRAVVPPAPRDLPYSGVKPKRKENLVGLKFCEHVLDELRKPKYDDLTIFFREPVDPVALNIPNYFSIIRQPMDIRTITNKLKTGDYSAAEDFKSDFDLMVANCRKFNPEGNLVRERGDQLKATFDEMWKEKNGWMKRNQPQSQRVSPASDVESDAAASEEEDEGEDGNEATIAQLKEQLASMQSMLGALTSAKRASPKAAGTKKKNRTSGGAPKTKKAAGTTTAAAARAPAKAKPKKQKPVTYEEKQEISNATEKMDEAQISRLTAIITENVSKYKDMAGDDVELEIDDLPDGVQRQLLNYVRSLFGRPRAASPPDDGAIDDEYEPAERGGKSGGGRKKHKPMKKAEQEDRIAQLKASMAQLQGGVAQVSAAGGESSDEEGSESSEEE